MVTQLVMSVPALVMKIFDPLITHCPSRSSAVVREAAASDPAPGSVSPNAASLRPEAGELRDQVIGEALLPVELLGSRRDARLRELADRAADELVLGREVEVHSRLRVASRRPEGDRPRGSATGGHRSESRLRLER